MKGTGGLMVTNARQPQQADFVELKRRIKDAGLLERQTRYYAGKILVTLGMLAAGLASIVFIHAVWFQALNAIFLAFVFAQIGFLAHDAGHKQILRGGRWNDTMCIFFLNLLLGGSASWWIAKHNAHHANPNHLDLDPDISLPFIAFEEGQALEKQGLLRFMVKYQAFFFFPLLSLEYYSLRVISALFLITGRPKHRIAETAAMLLHYPLFLGFVFWQLGLGAGLVFLVIQQGVTGLYIGASFAPNHKGMPMIGDDSDLDFVRRQVLTSRNITESRVSDYLFGTLATQIEHHLFPNMARNNLRKAEPLIKEFCRERSIAYYETGVLQAFREILHHLHMVGAPLRVPSR